MHNAARMQVNILHRLRTAPAGEHVLRRNCLPWGDLGQVSRSMKISTFRAGRPRARRRRPGAGDAGVRGGAHSRGRAFEPVRQPKVRGTGGVIEVVLQQPREGVVGVLDVLIDRAIGVLLRHLGSTARSEVRQLPGVSGPVRKRPVPRALLERGRSVPCRPTGQTAGRRSLLGFTADPVAEPGTRHDKITWGSVAKPSPGPGSGPDRAGRRAQNPSALATSGR
jgi:hypothetical protein